MRYRDFFLSYSPRYTCGKLFHDLAIPRLHPPSSLLPSRLPLLLGLSLRASCGRGILQDECPTIGLCGFSRCSQGSTVINSRPLRSLISCAREIHARRQRARIYVWFLLRRGTRLAAELWSRYFTTRRHESADAARDADESDWSCHDIAQGGLLGWNGVALSLSLSCMLRSKIKVSLRELYVRRLTRCPFQLR